VVADKTAIILGVGIGWALERRVAFTGQPFLFANRALVPTGCRQGTGLASVKNHGRVTTSAFNCRHGADRFRVEQCRGRSV